MLFYLVCVKVKMRTTGELVDDVLQYIAGRAVDAHDMFRLGRYSGGKTRHILVELRTVWDCQELVNSSRKLTDYVERIYSSRDEPPEYLWSLREDNLQAIDR